MTDPALPDDPDDLDGHTLDELADYLARGRTPADPSIEGSPACRRALAALARLDALVAATRDGRGGEPSPDVSWVDLVLAAIPVDARAGRRFPLAVPDPRVRAVVTEGALRGLVRAVGDGLPGLLVGSVRLRPEGDPAVAVEVAVVHGAAVPEVVGALRDALVRVLGDHLPFPIDRVDVRLVGLITRTPPSGRS